MRNLYKEPEIFNIDKINHFLISQQNEKAIEAIIGLSLYSENRQNLQVFILDLLEKSQDVAIKNACIKALSHIVRIDKSLDERTFQIIDKLKDNPLYIANINDLLDDIEIFLKNSQKV